MTNLRTIYSREDIQDRIIELGREITKDYQGQTIDVVGVLKGCFLFMADLIREIDCPMTCDFLLVSSYHGGKESTGEVRFDFDVTQPIQGKHVLLVEDIVDTGLTMRSLLASLESRNPASLKICSFLHKPARTLDDIKIDYLGFTIPDEFVVGYGLDYEGKYRNLAEVAVLEE